MESMSEYKILKHTAYIKCKTEVKQEPKEDSSQGQFTKIYMYLINKLESPFNSVPESWKKMIFLTKLLHF